MNCITRRDFARGAVLAGALGRGQAAVPLNRPTLCLFSKHLPQLKYGELAQAVKQLGFGGVDLTVRPEGHVLPERAAEDLPRAVAALRAAGLAVPTITTGFTAPSDPGVPATLAAAGRLGVPFFKMGYWRYGERDSIEARVGEVRRDVTGLVALGKEYGVTAGFHNHSGLNVGAAVWDTRAIIADMDPRWIGYYFDPCHATAEGGVGGWQIALRMALARIKMVAIKDFYWEKRAGKWAMRMCPLGEGMVDWQKFFSALANSRFSGPISLHVEYEPGDMLGAITHDFAFLRKQVDSAFGGLS